MILHILKKDMRLVWPAVGAVLVLKLASAWAVMQMGLFNEQPNLLPLQALIDVGASLTTGLAIVWALQSDPIVSDNADWLTRPVSRLQLPLAKALFALIVTFVPEFAVQLLVGLWQGLPFADCLARSILPSITAIFILGLPAMALGAITTSRIQAVGVVGAMLTLLVLAMQFNIRITHSLMLPRGLWSIALVKMATVVGASLAVIWLQYWRRRTSLSRGMFAGTAAVLMATAFLPWDMALRLQHVIDGKATGAPIQVGFNARTMTASPAAPDLMEMPIIYVPLTLSKTGDIIATTDHLQLKLQSADGRILLNTPAGIVENHGRSSLKTLARDPSSLSSAATYGGVAMPFEDYNNLKRQAVLASLTYYFTAYQASVPIRAVVRPGQRQFIDRVGVCEARRSAKDPAYTDLYCFATADQAPCVGGTVRYADTGKIVPLKTKCRYPSHFSNIEFVPPGRVIAGYPTPTVNGTVQITLTPYRLRNHFRQTVVVPPTRLENLKPPGPVGQ